MLASEPCGDDPVVGSSRPVTNSAAPITVWAASLVVATDVRHSPLAQVSGLRLSPGPITMDDGSSLAGRISLANVAPAPASEILANIRTAVIPSAMQWWIFIRAAHRPSGRPSMTQNSHNG